jgi:hypothetical protein
MALWVGTLYSLLDKYQHFRQIFPHVMIKSLLYYYYYYYYYY